MGFKSTWEGFTNYLTSTKEEIVSEWDEFQDEIDKTSSYEQSTTSDILQQTANGLSFAAEAVGSLVNNKSTRELASEKLEDITTSASYKEITQAIDKGISFAQEEANEYLDAHPETKAKLAEVAQTIDNTIDKGISHAQTFIAEHDEAFRNVGAVGAIVVAVVPLAKGAKALNAVHTVDKIDIDVASLKFSEVRHSQNTISFQKVDRETGQKFSYDDIKESMSKEGWKGEAVDVIEMPDGKLTSIDNSRVSAAKEVGISIKANVRNYDEKLSSEIVDSERFLKRNKHKEVTENPTTWGEAVSNRIENQPAHFRDKEAGQGSHDLPRVTGRPENMASFRMPVSARLMTKETAIVAGGVSTYLATKTALESSEEDYIPLSNSGMSLLPPHIATPNENIAEFIQQKDSQETSYTTEEPFDSTAKAQEILNDLYPHLNTNYENNITYDNIQYSNDMYDNNDSYGMERD